MKSCITVALSLLITCLISCQTPGIKSKRQNSTKSVNDELVYEPGGMWMPQQVAYTHAETLKRMGLEIDPQVFANPLEFPLNA